MRPSRRLGTAGFLTIAAVAWGPAAEAVPSGSRGCEGTGKFTFTVRESQGGNTTFQRDFSINILKDDLSVRVRNYHEGPGWRTYTKEWACENAAHAVVQYALVDGWDYEAKVMPAGSTLEHVNKKPDMTEWRRRVACNWARSGKIEGVKYRDHRRMTLVETRVDAVGRHHDSGHTESDSGSVREGHICWEDSQATPTGGIPPAEPAPPTRTGGAQLAVTAASCKPAPTWGPVDCPHPLHVTCWFETNGPGEVHYRVIHNGAVHKTRRVEVSTYQRHSSKEVVQVVREAPAAPAGIGGMAAAAPPPTTVRGSVQMLIDWPKLGVQRSDPELYEVTCKRPEPSSAAGPMVLAVPAPPTPQPPPAPSGPQPPAPRSKPKTQKAAPPVTTQVAVVKMADLRLGAVRKKGRGCEFEVVNDGSARSTATALRVSARGQSPVKATVPPLAPRATAWVGAKVPRGVAWRATLDPAERVAESDEKNNTLDGSGCQAAGR